MGNVSDVTDQTWEAEVLKSPTPVLVDVHSKGCPPCRVLAPVIEEIAGEYAGTLKVVKVDSDEAPETVASLGITKVPTLMVFKNGLEAMRRTGAAPKQALMAEIQRAL